jgi:hypothetical protein
MLRDGFLEVRIIFFVQEPMQRRKQMFFSE